MQMIAEKNQIKRTFVHTSPSHKFIVRQPAGRDLFYGSLKSQIEICSEL